jgi:Ca-activated chloride channel homolog
MYHISFANPVFFCFLLLIIPVVIWYIRKHKSSIPSMQVPSTIVFERKSKSLRSKLIHLPFILRLLVIILLIVVLARPQSSNSWKNVTSEGIDIMLTVDLSTSMLAKDFKPDRLDAAKDVATEFISNRPNDRMGLVVFSSESFTQCPLTSDHAALINLLRDVKSGMLADGTAIGLGLANAVDRIKDSNAKSKVIILLTDGVNNTGDIAPLTAAEIAKTFGIRVYTIGVGTKGTAPYPVQTPFGIQYQNMPVEIDEGILTQIANMTDGKYFRATNNEKLRQIYHEIDKMEKSKIDVKEFRKKKEDYLPFAMLAGLLLMFEIVLRNSVLRKIP